MSSNKKKYESVRYALIKILSGKAAGTSPAIWLVAILSVLSFAV